MFSSSRLYLIIAHKCNRAAKSALNYTLNSCSPPTHTHTHTRTPRTSSLWTLCTAFIIKVSRAIHNQGHFFSSNYFDTFLTFWFPCSHMHYHIMVMWSCPNSYSHWRFAHENITTILTANKPEQMKAFHGNSCNGEPILPCWHGLFTFICTTVHIMTMYLKQKQKPSNLWAR